MNPGVRPQILYWDSGLTEGVVLDNWGVRRVLLASSGSVGNLLMTQVGWDPCVQPISPL